MVRGIWHATIISFLPRRWWTIGSELDESRIEVPSGAESEGGPAVTLCARPVLERSILATGGNRGPIHPPPQGRIPGSFSLIGRKWMLVEIVILQSTEK